MSRTMLDSASTSGYKPGFDDYAGYINGRYVTYPQAQQMVAHTRGHALAISVFLADAGECLDVEQGDARPDQAPLYIKERIAAGVHRPVIYCSESVGPAVVDACRKAGLHRMSYRLWLAHWGHGKHICSPAACGSSVTADGTQWTDKGGGGKYDESMLLDTFFDGPRPRKRRWRWVDAGHTIRRGVGKVPGWILQAVKLGAGKIVRK